MRLLVAPAGALARQVIRTCLMASLLLAGCAETTPRQVPGGEASRGPQLLRDYGCHSCHVIPGVRGADGLVGPPLLSWSGRSYIAGYLPNTPENLVRWIRAPEELADRTVMPNMGITEQDARHIAAYLFTLR